MNLLLAMALIVVTWVVAVAAIYGLGCVVELFAPRLVPEFPFARGWIGVCMLLAALQWLHFFFPMNAFIAPTFMVMGLGGLFYGFARKKIVLPKTFGGEILMIACAVIWLANRATGQWLPYDTGYYHASTLQWFAQYPVVPGLANLHGPLALNSTSLLLAAAIDTGFFPRTSHHINCGLWIVMYLATFAAGFQQARKRSELRPIAIFDAALLPLLLAWALGANIDGLATDPPAIILCFVCVSACLRAMLQRSDAEVSMPVLFFAAFTGLTAITCKLSALIVVALALGLTLFLIRNQIKTPKSKIKTLLMLTIPLFITLAPWIGRNVIMSGYLVHPVPFTAVNVSWRLPAELAVEQAAWIRSWGRIDRATLEQTQGWNWLLPWAKNILQTHWGDLITPLALAAFFGVMLFRRRAERKPLGDRWLLLVAPLVALVFWFWNAPDVRLGGFLAAMELGVAAALVLSVRPTAVRVAGGALIVYGALIVAQQTVDFVRFLPRVPLRELFVYAPGDDTPMLPIDRPECVMAKTASGLEVYVPKVGNRVWAATLPAAPRVDPRLQLRYPPELRWGFEMKREE